MSPVNASFNNLKRLDYAGLVQNGVLLLFICAGWSAERAAALAAAAQRLFPGPRATHAATPRRSLGGICIDSRIQNAPPNDAH